MPAAELTVFRPGAEVTLPGDIKAIVRAIKIEGKHVSYNVIWPNGSTLTDMWLDDFLVHEAKATIGIGFRP